MTSIYQRALGDDFGLLHPKMQRRFGLSTDDEVAQIGRGVMDELWRGAFWTVPFLYLGTWRNIMFPDRGTNIPFILKNYSYTDGFRRETVTWIREFEIGGRRRRFDATMIYSETRGCIVDYLGTHQHLAVDLHLSPDRRGLRMVSGAQRFYEWRRGFRFPLFFSGIAEVREWYDDDTEVFRINVRVANPFWGPLFGYSGRFTVEEIKCAPQEIPSDVKPRREEKRE